MSFSLERDLLRYAVVAALLILAPLRLAAPLESHAGHAAGKIGTPVFAEASHAGQENHWEAAEPARAARCGACLAPGKLLRPEPAASAVRQPEVAGPTLSPLPADPREPDAGRPGLPRAPPPSHPS